MERVNFLWTLDIDTKPVCGSSGWCTYRHNISSNGPTDGPTGGRGMVQVLAVNPYGPWPYDRCRCAVAGLKRSKFDWAVGRGQCDSLYCIV